MKIGIMIGADRVGSSVTEVSNLALEAEKARFDSVWMAHIRSLDAISALSIAGEKTSKIELGTAVTPVQPRHPMALAQQAMTASQICEGRFTLGIGLSHKVVIEGMLGLSYDRPARYMRDYLGALLMLIEGKESTYIGELFEVKNLKIDIPQVVKLPVVVAALGPKMLEIAGTMTEGTSTWMTGPKTLENHVVKLIQAAAEKVGRSSPRVIAGFPVVLTNKIGACKDKLEKSLAIYGELPSYRSMLDKEGLSTPADLALIGDEEFLIEKIASIRSSGVTDLNAAIMGLEKGGFARTFEFLSSLASH